MKHFDAIIIGGGPAGLACAISLSKSGLKIALIEKYNYPKQPVCGDGLTEDIYNQLDKLSPGLKQKFLNLKEINQIQTLTVTNDIGEDLTIPLMNEKFQYRTFSCPRIVFDQLLYEEALTNKNLSIFCEENVKEVIFNNEGVLIHTLKEKYSAKIVVGADGLHSVVTRNMTSFRRNFDKTTRLIPSVQAYFKGISGLDKDEMKVIFSRPMLPYYFWIFPLQDGTYNVGLSMTKRQLKKERCNLKELLDDFTENHPVISKSFTQATRISEVKGRPIAAAVKKRPLSGDRFLLVGDAANATNYFTGEGVGNAIRTGRIAAETIVDCFQSNRFDARFMKSFDEKFYRSTKYELISARIAVALSRYPKLNTRLLKALIRWFS